MSPRTRGVVACAAVLAAVLLASGCGRETLSMSLPSLSAHDAAACRSFLADLPQQVAGQDRREVSPTDAPGAAWGSPPLALACGVAVPSDFIPCAEYSRANGVDWYIPDEQIIDKDESIDITMTVVGYTPLVQVVVPGDYRPEGLAAAMTEVGAVIRADLERTDPCPSE